ncbi:MAG: type II/IV secretion system protein [Candidatus Paceibacterota bacterium]|jgi:type II secretory ATPase GspE/PulE/Tfp pilus assembly ATPase PilB-like protein
MSDEQDQKNDAQTSERQLGELRAKEAEGLAQVLADHYKLPYLDLSKTLINTDALRLISEEEARQAGIAAFRLNGKNLSLALISPEKSGVQTIIDELKGKNFNVSVYLSSEPGLEGVWDKYEEISKSNRSRAGLIEISSESIAEFTEKFKTLKDIASELAKESATAEKEGGISGILEIIMAGGLVTEASDIHIEPEQEDIRLRYRLDGVLEDVASFPTKIYTQVISRLKLVSGMKLNIKKASQDGRFSIILKNTEIEIRASVIPSAYGESVVMRILNPESINVTFEKLGIEPELFEIFKREIHKPNGLVLLTGPTGSGKTTTLYSFLREVNSTESKIITIEDPIEYHLTGINQTQVNRKQGYTFLSGLRSALRQDPDIIMVGEIRDPETAKIAVQSSLTGHLVFSTLHTNNAQGAIPRLIDLGLNPKIITSALTLSIAQRLLRKLCEFCKQAKEPEAWEKELIEKVLESIKKKRPELIPATHKIYKNIGCEKCHGTGFKGREGIFEAIYMDDAVSAAAITNPNEKEIKIAAIPQKILDMRQDGILKVIKGETTIEEMGRVIDLYEEII